MDTSTARSRNAFHESGDEGKSKMRLGKSKGALLTDVAIEKSSAQRKALVENTISYSNGFKNWRIEMRDGK